MTVAKLPDVLPLVIQHCPSLHIRDLCRVLQVSNSCRQRVQQSRGHCQLDWYVRGCFSDVSDDDDDDDDADDEFLFLRMCEKVQGAAAWLVQHAGLVSSLDLLCNSICHREGHMLQHMLASAFLTCRLLVSHQQLAAFVDAGAAGTTSSSSQPAAAPLRAGSPQQLRLTHASLEVLPDPHMSQELAAANLQHLLFFVDCFESDPRIDICRSGFSCLTSLHSLDFGDVAEDEEQLQLPVQHLTQLTELRYALLDPTTVQQLPCSLQILWNCRFQADDSGSCAFDLRHLTALHSLEWYGRGPLGQHHSVQLPPSLTGLTAREKLHSISGGQGLQHVDVLIDNDAGLALLQSLSSLQQPWGLSLRIGFSAEVTKRCLRKTAAAISSATALTLLNLSSSGSVPFSTAGAMWCRQLAKLPNLRVLSLYRSLQRDDLLHLTVLTSLRELHCKCGPSPVFGVDDPAAADSPSDLDDRVAASLAASMSGLHALTLRSRSITKVTLLPALSGLTNLQQLDVHGGPAFKIGDAELMSLSRLTQLSKLELAQQHWSTEGGALFLQGMPYLWRIGPALCG